jgi:hypothetical protein
MPVMTAPTMMSQGWGNVVATIATATALDPASIWMGKRIAGLFMEAGVGFVGFATIKATREHFRPLTLAAAKVMPVATDDLDSWESKDRAE